MKPACAGLGFYQAPHIKIAEQRPALNQQRSWKSSGFRLLVSTSGELDLAICVAGQGLLSRKPPSSLRG